MKIIKERTRLMFTEYNETEERMLDDLVGTMDKVFAYKDPDGKMIGFPTGMEDSVKRLFPKIPIEDRSKQYWDYAAITPVQHNAQPRNQLQIDFIKFTLEEANKKRNVAGILSPGTGKANPLSTKIKTEHGFIRMGDIKIGDSIIGTNGNTIVTGVYPQGVKDIFKVTLIDGRTTLCTAEHLWQVKNIITDKIEIISLARLMRRHYSLYAIPVGYNIIHYVPIKSISYSHQEEAQCIMVDADDHLYMIDNDIYTHNTFMACYCAIKVGLKTLIITPTSSIKGQWAETLIKMFNVPEEKVKLINSPKDFINSKADFVITTQASLASLNKTYDLEKIMKANKFGIKVTDEVQMWFQNIINVDANCNIANNWYLTGTFGRSGDDENKLFQEMFSDLAIFREKEKEPTLLNRKPGNVYGMKPHMHVKMMWTHSGLSKKEIASVSSTMRYAERAGKWMRYGISIPAYTELVIPSDGTMTKFLKNVLTVIKSAEKEVKYGRTLILTSTVASCNVLLDYVSKMFPDKTVGTVNSKNSKDHNDKVKAEYDIIISTDKSAGTGFDAKGLAKLIVVTQYKSWILADQISGRLRRRDDGRDTYMWDIVDAQVPQLRAWANARADVLRRKSKSFKVVDL